MDDNYKIIYRILRGLERGMDAEEPEIMTAEQLGISEQRWKRIIEMLVDEGYIKGVRISKEITGYAYVDTPDPAITLRGLEYLTENTLMKRAYKAAKGVRDLMP